MEQSDQTSTSISTSSECSEQDNEARSSTLLKGQRTQAEKKMDRILANRRSARRSRERRKKLQQNLEISVAFLSRQNEELSRENNMLKQELRVMINLVDQMNKQAPPAVPQAASNNLGNESLLQQVRLAAAVSATPSATASPVDSVHNLQASLLPQSGAGTCAEGTPNEGFSGNLSSEQVLALSQLLTTQSQQQPHFFHS